MSTLDSTMKEIRKQMMENPNQEYFELSKNTLNYLLTSLQRYASIEEEMKRRVSSGERSTPDEVANFIKNRTKLKKDE